MVSGYLQDSCGLPGKYSGVSDSVVNDGSKRVDHRVTLQQNTYSWPNIFFCFFFSCVALVGHLQISMSTFINHEKMTLPYKTKSEIDSCEVHKR